MKVMGSAVMMLEVIVLGLVMPVAHVVYGYPLATVVWSASGLMLLCILSIGSMRRDRRTAVATGSFVQILVFITALFIKPFLVPAILFGLIWILAVGLSARVDEAKAAQDKEKQGDSANTETV
jgi:predicted membrane protein